jgi:pimeloyl-ACP methyl ester carboxylesterase
METAILPHATIQYLRCGHGTPMVLLHGFPLDSGIWSPVVPLLEKDFELILPNLRGFGGSLSNTAEYSLSDMADDVIHLLDHLGIEKAVSAGHSMGGYIALAIAKTYPDRLLGMGLISTQVLPDTSERRQSRYQAAAQVEEFGLEPLVKNMAEKLTLDLSLREVLSNIMRHQPEAGVIGALKGLAERPDQTSTLMHLQKPVLIVHGDADSLISVDRAWEMKEIKPDSVLEVIPKAGHMPMMENPVETAASFRGLI